MAHLSVLIAYRSDDGHGKPMVLAESRDYGLVLSVAEAAIAEADYDSRSQRPDPIVGFVKTEDAKRLRSILECAIPELAFAAH